MRPVFLENRSSPLEHQFFWAYFIRIQNNGGEAVRLIFAKLMLTKDSVLVLESQ